MKALSLWQPWATLMAAGYKRIETRSWAPRGLRAGDLVAIHAAKRWTDDEHDLCLYDPFFRRYLMLAQRRGLWGFEQPPLGCVVGIARFEVALPTQVIRPQSYRAWWPAEKRPIRHWITDAEYAFGNYGDGRFGWVFSAVRPIQPIPLRGERNLFEWMPSVNAVVYLEASNTVNATTGHVATHVTDHVIADALMSPTQAQPTRVVHVRRGEFDPANPNHVYIGRPMPRYPELRARGWGNPYKDGLDTSEGRQSAIDRYRVWILDQPKLLARLPELRGKVLGCWCALVDGLPGNLYGRVCHGEVLAALADRAMTQTDSDFGGGEQRQR